MHWHFGLRHNPSTNVHRAAGFALVLLLLIAPAWSAAANPRAEATTSPIARALTHEAARIVAAETAMRSADPLRKSSASTHWSDVQSLGSGEQIILTLRGIDPSRRYLVRAFDASLLVLNVSDPAIAAAKPVLVDTASDKPDRLMNANAGAEVVLNKHVRLAPDGVFVDDHKVAELGQVLENVPRADVVEISAFFKHFGRHIGRGALIGAGVGAVVALIAFKPSTGGGAFIGGAFGAAQGVWVGAVVAGSMRETPDVVYRAQ